MAATEMPHAAPQRSGARWSWRRWSRMSALIVLSVVLLAVVTIAILIGRQRVVLHRIPLPQVPSGYTTAPPTVPDAWTQWSTSSSATEGPTETEVYGTAWEWLRGATSEPPTVASFINTDATRRRYLLEALRTPLNWSSLTASPFGWPGPNIGSPHMLRIAAESLQLASAADHKPATELRGLDALALAMWPPVDFACLTCAWTIATNRDQAYLLAIAQGRLGSKDAASWLHEPAQNVTGLIDAVQVDLQYRQPDLARWDVESGPVTYHKRWMDTPSWPVDFWNWLQVPSAALYAMAVDHVLIQRLEGTGPTFPYFDVSAFRGGALRDTDIDASMAERAVLADVQHRALRLAGAMLLDQREHGVLPASLDQADIVDVGTVDVGNQPARSVDLPLIYRTISDSIFEIRVPADHKAPEFITPRCLTGEPVAATARAPIQELQGGLRVDCTALGR